MFCICHTTHITEWWERKTLPFLYDHLCKSLYLQFLFSEEVNDLGHTSRKFSLLTPRKRKKRMGKEKKLSMQRLLRLQCSLKRNNRFLPHITTGNLQEMCYFEAEQTQCIAVKKATVGTVRSLFYSEPHHILVACPVDFSLITISIYSAVFQINTKSKYFKCQTKLQHHVDCVLCFLFKGIKII